MMHLGEDEITQAMGIGYPGEVRMGPDGNLYEWVGGYDALGNPIGWGRLFRRIGRGLRWVGRRVRPFLRRALPIARFVSPFIPGIGPAMAAGLRFATPILQRGGFAGHGGLGALYQGPDGTLYPVAGFGEDEELRGLGEDDDLRGMGALYQAPDGTVYQVQGVGEDEELRGLAEDEDLRGFAEDEELRGLAEDEELRGLAEDEELRGFAEDEELRGFAEDGELRGLAEDEELRGLEQGYVPDGTGGGLDGYVPEQPLGTRWFVPPAQPPEMWRPLW